MKPKSVDRFLRDLPRDLRAVLFFGPDAGQVRERAKALARSLVPDLSDPFAVTEIAAGSLVSDPARLYDEMAAQSLMGGRRLVRIREGTEGAVPALQSVLEAPPPGDTFLIVEAGELGGSSKLRKLFEGAEVLAAALPCYEPDAKDLATLAADQFRAAGITASRDAVALFATLIASDRAMARSELDKLILYAGPNGKLDEADVAAALGDSAQIGLEAPAWAAGERAVDALDRSLTRVFADGQSPVGVLRAAQRHFTRLYEVVSATGSLDSALKALRPPLFWKDESRFRQQVSLWTTGQLEAILARLLAAEADCKKSGLPDTVLCSRLLMGIAGMASRGR